MNLSIETSVSAITIFIQGLISFFSPCVLPLIPLYIGYLSGGAQTTDEDGTVHYKRGKVMLNTLFFVIGISFAFFLLGLGFTAAGRFFNNYQSLFTRIGGIIVILFGLNQLGIFKNSGAGILGQDRRLKFRPDRLAMNPLTALVLGFTFSFAWTPCVGPALASVLIMAASAASSTTGFILIGVFTLGFVLPFMAVGLFTGTLLDFFQKHRSIVKYTVKIGGILMILIGVMMFTGWMNNFSSYLSGFGTTSIDSSGKDENISTDIDESTENMEDGNVSDSVVSNTDNNVTSDSNSDATTSEEPAPKEPVSEEIFPAPDFTLTDQFGNSHVLSDYKGKTVFLNFWATWCPPCRAEMPEIQEIYEEYGENAEDVIILGIASPNVGNEGSADDISAFLEKNGYTYPVVMDTDGVMSYTYGINAYPTTFMIDAEGNIFGYVSGQLTKDIMKSIITQTMEGVQATNQ